MKQYQNAKKLSAVQMKLVKGAAASAVNCAKCSRWVPCCSGDYCHRSSGNCIPL